MDPKCPNMVIRPQTPRKLNILKIFTATRSVLPLRFQRALNHYQITTLSQVMNIFPIFVILGTRCSALRTHGRTDVKGDTPICCGYGYGDLPPDRVAFSRTCDLSECIFHEVCICILSGYEIQDMFCVLSGSE